MSTGHALRRNAYYFRCSPYYGKWSQGRAIEIRMDRLYDRLIRECIATIVQCVPLLIHGSGARSPPWIWRLMSNNLKVC